MCLFLTALLREGRIGLEEYGIEIREFCILFSWVVEAADVFHSGGFD
jgi:CCR4-NOT transcription complex subunit 11